MYLELAEQKEEQEKQRKENAPKERDYDKEHREAREKQRYFWIDWWDRRIDFV